MLSQLRYKNLKGYFVDVDGLYGRFSKTLKSQSFTKNILIIHGVGGIGKTTLLHMFGEFCKDNNYPIGFASGNDNKISFLDILISWNQSLKSDEIVCQKFSDTLSRYNSLKKKLEREEQGPDQIKTVINETTEAISHINPFAGHISKAIVAGFSAYKTGSFSKSDQKLLKEPAIALTDDFITDLNQIAKKRNCVLILDAFEWITQFQEGWMCRLAQNIHQNVLLVIAGRKTPNWRKEWPDWRIKAEIKKLEPFNAKDIKKLTHNYYKALFGSNPKKTYVEKTVKDSYGLPIVATTLVDFHMTFPEEDLSSIKTGVYTETVNKIRKSVPKDMFALLEAASTVRWYNEDVLSTLTNHTDFNTAYMQLQHCQLIQPSAR